jgi:2-amino-4-hydroxy-6-hydroxymethyldihydropteridine diphosphokinase
MGPKDQPDFVNAVVALDTALAPHALLRELQAIECRHGRVRGTERWGPRTLDIDLLLYGDLQMEDELLTLPHPGLPERNFVLYPLHEIAPCLEIAGMASVSALISRCSAEGLQVLQA